jgi:hypothetical protein
MISAYYIRQQQRRSSAVSKAAFNMSNVHNFEEAEKEARRRTHSGAVSSLQIVEPMRIQIRRDAATPTSSSQT